MAKRNAISPTREENYPEWYQEVIKASQLAEHSAVRGCMVIKPWGYAVWENIQKYLDQKFKETGHQNAYFPLFIPLSYFEKEAKHVKGFAKECAVVTHHRLEEKEGKLIPSGELEEPLIVRPTSEMIIGDTFQKWVKSHRDLPLLINQWANVVRWEMRTRLFLRTTEFLWQEGHTVHETKQEAEKEALQMLSIYVDFAQNVLAMPVIAGRKTEDERFPGAVDTYTFEAMMQDGKALQAGTSHFLGQNFSKSCDIQFQNREGNLEYGWMTSWGVTTRLIGGMVMVHSDDDGLVLPPRIAPKHIVIIPILHDEEKKSSVLQYCESLKQELQKQKFFEGSLQVEIDARDLRGGEKIWGWVKKGAPILVEIGPKEVEKKQICYSRRDLGRKEKKFVSIEEFIKNAAQVLEEMQEALFQKAKAFADSRTHEIQTKKDFYDFFQSKEPGFALSHYSDDAKAHEILQKDLNVTARCIPIDAKEESGKCLFTDKTSKNKVVFAKAY